MKKKKKKKPQEEVETFSLKGNQSDKDSGNPWSQYATIMTVGSAG
jgi:hypothetical protein